MSASNASESANQGSLASNDKHALDVKVGNDEIPEFHVQTLPAGTAPTDRTFKPNTDAQTDVPGNPPSAADNAGKASQSDDTETEMVGRGELGMDEDNRTAKANTIEEKKDLKGAEEMVPETAESLAAEFK